GVTKVVPRPSAAASELTAAELRAGAGRLERLAGELRPAHVAVLGVQAYRAALRRPRAAVGEQAERVAGARLWVLPNPSGLQAHYQVPDMAVLYGALRTEAGGDPSPPGAPAAT
ncbi:MAG: uracil-DNA glycosylase family protein, partial [Acidimicrobiales bacterium]